MNYQNQDITARAKESPLWDALEKQRGNTIPYLLERYLLLENWQYRDRLMEGERHTSIDDMQYVHLLLAETATVLLAQEERIRKLEERLNQISASTACIA